MGQIVVFTDVDGTLLDKTYDAKASRPAIAMLQQKHIPIILCSAKTISELQLWRKRFGICDPFVVENGAAVMIPEEYFPFSVPGLKSIDRYILIELGASILSFRSRLLQSLESSGIGYQLFTDMSVEEIAQESGLPIDEAKLAKNRQYTETVKLEGNKEAMEKTTKTIMSNGLDCSFGGRHLIVGQGTSKGKGVSLLRGLYQRYLGKITTCAFGDAENDLSMFKQVDRPFLLQRSNGHYADVFLPGLIKINSPGPSGFTKGVDVMLDPSGQSP